jgi:hypothetical protein
MEQTIISALGVIVAAVFTAVIRPAIMAWVEQHKTDKLYNIVYELVLAAEQTWKDKPGSGEEKLAYVFGELKRLGIEITPTIEIWITAFVSGLNGNIIKR